MLFLQIEKSIIIERHMKQSTKTNMRRTDSNGHRSNIIIRISIRKARTIHPHITTKVHHNQRSVSMKKSKTPEKSSLSQTESNNSFKMNDHYAYGSSKSFNETGMTMDNHRKMLNKKQK